MSALIEWLSTPGWGQVATILALCAVTIIPFGLWQAHADRSRRRG